VLPNDVFNPRQYWVYGGCCWNGNPDEKGIETEFIFTINSGFYFVGMVTLMRRGLKHKLSKI
jgi:hypothetical protein